MLSTYYTLYTKKNRVPIAFRYWYSKSMNGLFRKRGFALPVVLISSIVMMMILLVSLTSITSLSSSIQSQYSDKLLSEANEAGLAYATACIQKNDIDSSSPWTELYPGADCTNSSSPSACPTNDMDASCWVYAKGSLRTTFTVDQMTLDSNGNATAKITAELLSIRKSNNVVLQTRTDAKKVRIVQAAWDDVVMMNPDSTSACGLTNDQVIYCWGDNTYGQLGDGTTISRPEAKPIADSSGQPSALRFTRLTANLFGTACGITTSNDAYCWGQNPQGQAGVGDTNPRYYPTQISMGANTSGKWTEVDIFSYSSCGLGYGATVGKLYCWGQNPQGNLGDGTTTNRYTPVQVAGTSTYTDFDGGAHHVCAMPTSGALRCWGMRVNTAANWWCELLGEPNPGQTMCPGLGGRGNDFSPTDTGIALTGVDGLVGGPDEMCLRMDNNNLQCFGANFKGQAGDGGYGPDGYYAPNANRAAPIGCVKNVALTCLSIKSSIHGAYSRCGIDANDEAWCWGLGQYAMHGDGLAGFTTDPIDGHDFGDGAHKLTVDSASQPSVMSVYAVKVSGGYKFKKLFTGIWSFCGMTFDNELYCWGRAKNSIFGIKDGTARYYTAPILAPNVLRSPPRTLIY